MEHVPAKVRAAALAAFAKRVEGAVVADLEFDSLLDGKGVDRSERALQFVSPTGGAISLLVDVVGDRRRLEVAVDPPQRASVQVIFQDSDTVEGETFDDGTAQLSDLDSGIVTVLVHGSLPLGRVRTAWIRI